MINTTSSILLLAVVSLVFAGCCSGARGTEDAPRLEIHLSSGGGVSGMSTGFSILTDGTVTKWTAFPRGRETEQTVGMLRKEEYHALVSEILATDFRALRQQETGNMTASLRITQGEEMFTYLWPGLHDKEQDVPPALRPLWQAVWTRIASIVASSDHGGDSINDVDTD